eukprot:798244-Amorphochlora_amoeboformis.AAC.2
MTPVDCISWFVGWSGIDYSISGSDEVSSARGNVRPLIGSLIVLWSSTPHYAYYAAPVGVRRNTAVCRRYSAALVLKDVP